MALIYQHAQFYCRGSLANETMANLTPEQNEESMDMALKIAAYPEMEKHRKKFYRELGKTIKGDYVDWKESACKQDCLIAIWRGVCMLLYHHKYSFICELCNATTYKSKGEKKNLEIQSRRTGNVNNCPSCGKTHPDGSSPIKAIKHQKMYDNPWDILMDEEQLCKFFGQILSNTCKQQLRENTIKSTKRSVLMTDFADQNVKKDLEKILQRFKVAGVTTTEMNQGSFVTSGLYFEANSLPSEFVGTVMSLRRKAEENGVVIKITNSGIEIQRTPETKTITTTVEEKYRISMLLPSQGATDAPDILEVSSLETDHCSSIITRELVEKVRSILPTDDCISVLELKMETGEAFRDHMIYYGDTKPTCKSTCELLNITKAEYEMCIAQIRAAMLLYGFTPDGDGKSKKKNKTREAVTA